MRTLLYILVVLLTASQVLAEPITYTKKNTARRECGTILDITTVKRIGAAVTGIDCEYAQVTDASNEVQFVDLATAETVVGTLGQFCFQLTAAETNIDGEIRVYCSATNASSAAYEIAFTTRKTDVADSGIGPLSVTFDGQTTAEGANTLTLAAGAISANNQYVGDKIALFNTAGKYYASTCILGSVDSTEVVTTEENLQALHTVGDYYVIRPDAGCQITADKLQAAAVTKIVTGTLTTPVAELSAIPSAGTETLQTIWRAVYQRFFSKVSDDQNVLERQLFKADGTTKLCEAPLTRSGNIYTTGACGPVD